MYIQMEIYIHMFVLYIYTYIYMIYVYAEHLLFRRSHIRFGVFAAQVVNVIGEGACQRHVDTFILVAGTWTFRLI